MPRRAGLISSQSYATTLVISIKDLVGLSDFNQILVRVYICFLCFVDERNSKINPNLHTQFLFLFFFKIINVQSFHPRNHLMPQITMTFILIKSVWKLLTTTSKQSFFCDEHLNKCIFKIDFSKQIINYTYCILLLYHTTTCSFIESLLD